MWAFLAVRNSGHLQGLREPHLQRAQGCAATQLQNHFKKLGPPAMVAIGGRTLRMFFIVEWGRWLPDFLARQHQAGW